MTDESSTNGYHGEATYGEHRSQRESVIEPVPVLDSASVRTFEVEVLEESYWELESVLRENEWEHDEGLRTVFMTGLGYLLARLRLERLERAEGANVALATEHLNAIINDLATYHSMYSVMKYKAFKLYKLNQVLGFNNSGLRATEEMWQGWANRMRAQQLALQEEIKRLRTLLDENGVSAAADLGLELEAGLRPPPPPHEEPLPTDRAPYVERVSDFEPPTLIERLRRRLRRS
jgi:hypothetical protein